MDRKRAEEVATMTAAMIDGFWLRAALSHQLSDFDLASRQCKAFINNQLAQLNMLIQE